MRTTHKADELERMGVLMDAEATADGSGSTCVAPMHVGVASSSRVQVDGVPSVVDDAVVGDVQQADGILVGGGGEQ